MIRLAPWLAPEIVVFMQTFGSEIATVLPKDDLSATEQNYAALPSLGTDVYGFARVIQELFDVDCRRRFHQDKRLRNTSQNCHLSERRAALSVLRPIMRQAFKNDPSIRPAIEDFHALIVKIFWVRFYV